MKRFALGWISFLILFFACCTTTFAHANLITSNPHDGQVVDRTPEQVTLDFSEQLEPDLIDLKLYDWNARPVAISSPQLTPGKSSEMYVKLPHLNEGTYTVIWNVVSQDGHPVSDSFVFSVGSITADGAAAIHDPSVDVKRTLFILIRYVAEGLILLGGGVYWLSWLAQRRGFPGLKQVAARGPKLVWLVLSAGTIAEWLSYSSTLPGGGLNSYLLQGRFNLLAQAPFAEMVLIQFGLLLLLAIPRMQEAWHLLLWTSLVVVLAFGGHAWGIQPFGLAVTVRVLHVVTIALWLGALTYLALVLRWERRSHQTLDRAGFRPFFFRIAAAAAGMVVLTGIVMVLIQTDWASLLRLQQTWSMLLVVKIGLVVLMLVAAFGQTSVWRQDGHTILHRLLKWEWLIGLLTVFVGVWMSQSAYPLPVKSYSQTLQADHIQATVEISQLKLGNQKMTVRLQNPDGKIPVRVEIDTTMEEMQMDPAPLHVTKTDTGQYTAVIPFTMSGKWKFSIDAQYPDGSQASWSDEVLIPQGGE